jgi:MFS transporter, DHA2 family, multidrug resistance protein
MKGRRLCAVALGCVDSRAEGLPASRRGWAVAVTGIGVFMTMMDQTIANVALPTIAHDVHASAAASVWVLNAFQIGILISLFPLASLADIVGYQRTYVAGMAIFGLASLGCVFSHDITQLAIARFAQGLGSATINVSTGPLNRLSFPPHMLGRATGYTAMLVALGSASGPVIGGFILAVASWQWLFAINIPIAIFSLVVAPFVLPRFAGSGGRWDVVSAALCIVAFGAGIFGFDAFGHGDRSPLVVAELVVALVAAVTLVRRQLALAVPMIVVRLFANVRFDLALLTCSSAFVAQTLAYVALPFALQTVMGYTPLEIGLFLLPWLIAQAAISPVAGRLADRVDASRLAAIGMGVFGLGLLALTLMPAHASAIDIAWRTLICGAGYGFYQSPNNRSIQGSVPRERSAATQGMQAMARLFGQVGGATLAALIFRLSPAGTRGTSGTDPYATLIVMSLAVAFTLLGVTASVLRGRLRAPTPATAAV